MDEVNHVNMVVSFSYYYVVYAYFILYDDAVMNDV